MNINKEKTRSGFPPSSATIHWRTKARCQQKGKLVGFPCKKAQAALDYVIFFTIIIATLLIMGYYIRNSLAGKYRDTVDTFGTGEVYSPNVAIDNQGTMNPNRSTVTSSIEKNW